MQWVRGSLVAIAGVAIAGLAWAQTRGARSIRVAYDAPAGCPGAPQLVAEIRARTARVTIDEHASEVVRIAVERRDHGFVGHARFAGPDGETRRRVEGGTCSEVVSALALVTALAVDPTAALAAPATASSASSAASPPSANGSPAATDAGVASASSSSSAPAAAASSSAPPAAPKPPPPPATRATPEPGADDATSSGTASLRGWRWSIGVDGEAITGIAPNVVFAAPVFFEVADVTEGLFGFDVRARFAHAGTGGTTVPGGALDFTWTLGGLDVCPLAWSPGRARVVLCARGEGGVLDASGVNILPARSDARPWLIAGAAARASYRLWGPFLLEAEVAGFAPILRDRFYFEPSTTAFRPSVAGVAAALGLGAAF